MKNEPFYKETTILFESVSKHDFDTLAALCDDDFGIVDLDEEGKNVIIEDRQGWENWFKTLFSRLKGGNARTYTDILKYKALKENNLGYSVVNFDQHLIANGQHLVFNCVTTIIWKNTDRGWKESRWHCSLIQVRPFEIDA